MHTRQNRRMEQQPVDMLFHRQILSLRGERMSEDKTTLVGYVRKANEGAAIKLAINKEAFEDCKTYTTSDGQQYIPLVISLQALRRVIDGERTVTTVSQITQGVVEELYDCGCINHGDDENVGCESCRYISCLDCHHINSQSANTSDYNSCLDGHHVDSTPERTSEWKCYLGYGCNPPPEEGGEKE